MNKEEIIYPSMVIRSQAETIELLEKENKQLQNNWNELKEWLEEEMNDPLNFNNEVMAHHKYEDILEKMQELESRK